MGSVPRDVAAGFAESSRKYYLELQEAKRLLRLATCPECKDGSGAYARECIGYDGEADLELVQCQWCDEKNKLIAGPG